MEAPASIPSSLPQMTLPMHGLTRYLRVRIEVRDGLVRWAVPRTVLGVVPVGTRHTVLPVSDLRSAGVRVALAVPRLLIGLGIVVTPWFVAPWWQALPVALVGAVIGLTSSGPHLEVTTLGGKRHRAPVCHGHRFDADLFAEALGDLIARSGGPRP